MQKEVFAWRQQAFDCPPTLLLQAAKMAEEAGEVIGAVVKKLQRVKQDTDWSEEIKKEMADLMFVMFVVAELEGFDLLENAGEQWKTVSQKDYKQ